MVEVGKIGDKTLVLDGCYISIFKEGKLVWKRAYMGYYLPDGNLYWYRRRVRITERSGNTLTDYQIKIEMGAGDPIFAHARSAGEDIRFCYYPEENMIPYWIEKFDPVAEEAIIWVKVPEIPANSEIEIFMYYGNPGVASASDGEATFDFFDDFEGTSLDTSKWDDSNAGSYSIADSAIGMTGDWNDKVIKTVKTDFAMPLIVELRIRASATDNDIDIVVPFNWVPWAGDGDGVRWDIDAGEKLNIIIGGTGYIHGSGFPDTNWHRARATFTPSEFKIWADWDTEYSDSGTPTNTVGWLGLFADPEAGRTGYVDWYAVRKYASPEPSVSVGAEE